MIEFVRAVAWPSVVLIGLYLFYPHVDTILNSFARRADQIDGIKLGSLEINVKASNLPTASKRLAVAISALDKDKIQTLISLSSEINYCGLAGEPSSDDFSRSRQAMLWGIENAALITLVRSAETDNCKAPLTAKLTALGEEAREFIFALIGAQVQGAAVTK